MHKITNLTNSPQNLYTVSGKTRLPARGSVTDEFNPDYLAALEASKMYVVEVAKASDIIEARKGGELPKADYRVGTGDKEHFTPTNFDLETLREEAASLDIKVDGRWSAHRLQQEIDKALK